MNVETYDRKPFSVLAVQVDFDNVNEVAEWCKGTIIRTKSKMLGVETELPSIRVDGQGENRGKSFVATLGCYIVELKGSFRVYKPAQFASSFAKAVQHALEHPNDLAMKGAHEEDVFVEHLIEDESDEQGADELPTSA